MDDLRTLCINIIISLCLLYFHKQRHASNGKPAITVQDGVYGQLYCDAPGPRFVKRIPWAFSSCYKSANLKQYLVLNIDNSSCSQPTFQMSPINIIRNSTCHSGKKAIKRMDYVGWMLAENTS